MNPKTDSEFTSNVTGYALDAPGQVTVMWPVLLRIRRTL